jgi:hypothetical protein
VGRLCRLSPVVPVYASGVPLVSFAPGKDRGSPEAEEGQRSGRAGTGELRRGNQDPLKRVGNTRLNLLAAGFGYQPLNSFGGP